MHENLTFIGLNEFNPDLISNIAGTLPKGNYLSKLLACRKIECTTEDQLDSGYLEPWVQWVSIQTGTPSAIHGIKNLGDIMRLKQPQLWERLSKIGKSSIIWGAMNARRGDSDHCQIFLPDPWVFDEPAFPDEIGAFVELPRYLAKNYTSLSAFRIIKLAGAFLANGFRHAGLQNFLKFFWLVARGMAKFGPRNMVFICGFEYLSAAAFCRQAKNLEPDLSFIFLNSLAHVQHHYWKSTDIKRLSEIKFAYATIEKILALMDRELNLFSPDRRIVVSNGLSQVNTSADAPWVLYRVRNMDGFLNKLDVSFSRVETLMSYDGHIIFDNLDDMKTARRTLADVHINDVPLLLLEAHPDQLKLFFRIDFSEVIGPETSISIGSETLNFGDEIAKVVVRTGKHSQNGVIYHNCSELGVDEMSGFLNHNLFKIIYPELFFDDPVAQPEADRRIYRGKFSADSQ